uniref:VIP1 protein n=1 Tax=Zea mays TaxID=4577 RepID=A0A804QRT6_MAIZE
MENGDETLASPTAAAETDALNGGVAEEEQVPITHPAKSYVTLADDNPAPNGGVVKEEEGGAHTTAKSYAAVAAQAEIEDLRAAKLDLEEKLAEARRENKSLAEETHRSEGIFTQAREEVTIAEFAATSAEKEVERLDAVLRIEKGEHELDKQRHEKVAKEVDAVRQEKLKLEEEIRALKASATAAATTKEREAAPASEAPKEGEVAWLGMAVAAAAGAAGTAAIMLVYLRLKR